MTPSQASTIKTIERNLIAPCCYTQSIDLHMSDIAGTMRGEVTQMVLAGQTDTQIYAHYKAIYGEQILMVPDGRLGKIAYATPITAATLGSGLLFYVLYKVHRRKSALAVQPAPPQLDGAQAALRLRVRDAARDPAWLK